MATFVLLHGSFHAAWNWHRVVPLLERLGHRVVALDLPGHGRDRTAPRKVSLAACVRHVLEAIPDVEPVILVAHSRNGIVISQAAEAQPDRTIGLIYLAAYLVPNGKTMMDYACTDNASLVVQNTTAKLPQRWIAYLVRWLRNPLLRWLSMKLLPRSWQVHTLRPSAYQAALYHDCPADILELADSLLEPEPHWSGFTPLRLTQARYGKVPRVYIECTEDRAVTLALQRRMQQDSPGTYVMSLDAGHSPFFSQPEQLVGALLQCANRFCSGRGS